MNVIYNPFLLYLGRSSLSPNKIITFFMNESSVLVELFFIMAGVLFFVSSRTSILNKKSTFDNFIIKKVSRLFPVIIISNIFVYICNFILVKSNMTIWSCGFISLHELFLSFFQGKTIFSGEIRLNAPLWYIGIYMICIVIAYYLTLKSKKYGDKVFLIPIIFSLIIYYNFTKNIPILSHALVRGLNSFFVGVFVGKFLNLYNDFSKRRKAFTKVICLLFLLFYVYCFHINRINDVYNPSTFTYPLFVFVPFIIFMYGFKNLNKFFSLKIFKFLGNISYGVYVWNFPILLTFYILYCFNVIHYNAYSRLIMLLLFIIHVIVATLSYYFIELKCKNIKFNFIKKLLN